MALARWTAARRTRFIEELRRTANISAAARAAGIDRKSAYRLRARNEDFREDWDHALEEALDELEAELLRRAIRGVEKPVYYGGKPCGTVTSYSDTLGMFLLRYRRPHIFAGGVNGEEMDERELASAKDRLGRLLERHTDTESEQDDTGAGGDGSA